MNIDKKLLIGAALVLLLLVNTCTTCSTSRKASKALKQTEMLSNKMDSSMHMTQLEFLRKDSIDLNRMKDVLVLEAAGDKNPIKKDTMSLK